MEGQIAFRQNAAELPFVCDGVVENFDNFRHDSAVEKDGANGAKALFPQKDKQKRDEDNAHADTKQMLQSKQSVVRSKNR